MLRILKLTRFDVNKKLSSVRFKRRNTLEARSLPLVNQVQLVFWQRTRFSRAIQVADAILLK